MDILRTQTTATSIAVLFRVSSSRSTPKDIVCSISNVQQKEFKADAPNLKKHLAVSISSFLNQWTSPLYKHQFSCTFLSLSTEFTSFFKSAPSSTENLMWVATILEVFRVKKIAIASSLDPPLCDYPIAYDSKNANCALIKFNFVNNTDSIGLLSWKC